MGNLIYPDGTHRQVVPEDGKHFTLDELQELVGGYIEILRNPKGKDFDAVLNEEGKLHGLDANPAATEYCGVTDLDTLVGNVLILEGEERVQ